MKIIRKINNLRTEIRKIKSRNKAIGFVPTMGALHKGHLSLIQRAHRENDFVVVSIFVNPTQFGPKEDFKKYPRNLSKDIRLCKEASVDIIFYPDIKEMYPANYRTYVEVKGLSNILCGVFRPGHFTGVATVVTKLFNIVNPDIAYFGQKDAQQEIIIKKLVYDLNMPLKIKVMPTVREKDGLAMSSRNIYLNKEERKDALVLFQSLNLAKNLIRRGIKDSGKIICSMRHLIQGKKTARIDYVSIVDLDNLEPVKKINPVRNINLKSRNKISNGVNKKCLIALAVWIGKTRLIDNRIINPK